MIKNIYFDYQATTPVDPRVIDKMFLTLVKFMATLTQEIILMDGKQRKQLKLREKMLPNN